MALDPFTTATRLAELIRRREVSSLDVVRSHLERIKAVNARLNAIVTVREQALDEARLADEKLAREGPMGPLHGVPVTIKDGLEVAGTRTTAGHKGYAQHVPTEDASVVRRLKEAGAIILGKTNLSELARDCQCFNPVFGRTLNPWDVERTPGGSTGGGAAALAAGMSPLEIGSDVGGSLRIPAHFCGTFSLKPTEHRISTYGHIQGPPSGVRRAARYMFTVGPMARSVEDLQLAFAILAGPDGREWEVPPVPLRTVPRKEPAQLRIAWTDDVGGVPLARDVKAAMAHTVGALSSAGCVLERASPEGFDFQEAWLTWGELNGHLGFATFPRWQVAFARMLALMPGPIEKGLGRGASQNSRALAKVLLRRDALISALDGFLGRFDAWLLPISQTVAIKHQRMGMSVDVDGRAVNYWLACGGATAAISVVGNPAIALPVARGESKLPIGLQLVGRRFGDEELLGVAETVAPVVARFEKPPDFAA